VSLEQVKVPDLGDAGEVEVIEVLVKIGQSVAKDDSLIVLESDKAAMEIPAPMAGIVKSLAVKVGDQVKTGNEILSLEVEGKASAATVVDKPVEKAAAAKAETPVPAPEKPPTAAVEKSARSAPASAVEDIKVPDLGGESEVEVIEVHVADGARIAVDEPLITLESDKAAMEVPSPKAGQVKKMQLKVGDKVSTGTVILSLQVEQDSAVDSKPTAAAASTASAASSHSTAPQEPVASVSPHPAAPAQSTASAEGETSGESIYAGPAVRKLARELGVNLAAVAGTGTRGRILKEDVNAYVKARLSAGPVAGAAGAGIVPVPDQDFSQFGEIEQVSLSKLHRITAANMHRNWTNIPHVAQFNEADITDLEAFRLEHKAEADKRGVKLTFLPFLLKACARALQEYPQFNVSLHSSGDYLIQKKYIHIGVAVATDAGLVVPVVRNVDQKNIWQLAREVAELSDKAKQRRLSREDMQGACFSISSLGALGGTGFIPIVNAPEVAILGVSKTVTKPVYLNDSFVPRSMLPLTLSYDHRAVNGVDGGLFATYLAKVLGDIRLLLL
jgi:pyruvate dehydrogenase E2 component (dihydrolipoamide acetyltransferase)